MYQVVDGTDLFTHGIFDDVEKAKAAALRLRKQRPRTFRSVQVNRIPLNQVCPASEDMDSVWGLDSDGEEV